MTNPIPATIAKANQNCGALEVPLPLVAGLGLDFAALVRNMCPSTVDTSFRSATVRER